MIRAFCECPRAAEPSTDAGDTHGVVHLSFRVYLSRLWFELIADASYGQLLSGLAPCAAARPLKS